MIVFLFLIEPLERPFQYYLLQIKTHKKKIIKQLTSITNQLTFSSNFSSKNSEFQILDWLQLRNERLVIRPFVNPFKEIIEYKFRKSIPYFLHSVIVKIQIR